MTGLLLSILLSAAIPEELTALMEESRNGRVELTYSCLVPVGEAPVRSEGTLLVESNCYLLKANGLEIYCDGRSRWSVDPEAKEVYIEEAPGVLEFVDDTERYFSQLKDFRLLSSSTSGPVGNADEFRFDDASLPPDWVVTDLRQ